MAVVRGDVDNVGNSSFAIEMAGNSFEVRRNILRTSMYNSNSGIHVTSIAQNPVLEYETPFYTLGKRFVPARETAYDRFGNGHNIILDLDNPATRDARLDKFISIGEDFQLGLFVGAPVFYSYAEPAGGAIP